MTIPIQAEREEALPDTGKRSATVSGDVPEVKPGDEAPEPDDGRYQVITVNAAEGTMLIRWHAKGRTFQCWVPQNKFEKIPKH